METPKHRQETGIDSPSENADLNSAMSDFESVSGIEYAVVAAETAKRREVASLVEATNREISRLAYGDFAKLIGSLDGKPDLQRLLRPTLESYTALGDDDLLTTATRQAKEDARHYLEGGSV